jgi:hypothetical protein
MAGGHATTAGIVFQSEVGAWFAAHILCERSPLNIGDTLPIAVKLEALSPVDDIVVLTTGDIGWYVNVKSEVAVSSLSNSPLSKVVDQFVRQVLYGVDRVEDTSTPRRWNYDADRLILAVRAGGSGSLIHGLSPVIKRLADGASRFGVPLLTNQGETAAFNAFFAQANYHWTRHTGESPSEAEILKLLSCVRCLEIDTVGADRMAAISMLESVVGAEDAATAFDLLVTVCMTFAKGRSGGDIATLREELNSKGISTQPLKGFANDISKLKRRTESALADMSRYAKIEVHADNDRISASVEIQRACVEQLIQSAVCNRSFLVIGEPGSGKSGAMYLAARELSTRGHDVLCLQVDELEGATSDLLLSYAGLDHPIADVLANWKPSKNGILLIDALDASRGMGSEAGVQALITEVLRKAPHWTIVATIRKFDLRYGTHYQRLFEGSSLSKQFVDAEFPRVAHLNVPQLSADEVRQVREQWPSLDEIAAVATPSVISMLSTPFNLYLLGRSLGLHQGQWTATTQLELLEQFWTQRVEHDFVTAEASSNALELLLTKMLEQRCLFAYTTGFDGTTLRSMATLQSDGILYRPESSRQLKFAHHMLFDFALAKLVFMRDGIRSIPVALEEHATDVLMVAPASTLALAMAWHSEACHTAFWDVALGIATNDALGAFMRTLPAKVAAEQVRMPEDVSPLVLAMNGASTSKAAGATFLARHILNVLIAGVVPGRPKFGGHDDPWCEIVRNFSVASSKDLHWPLNAVIANWSAMELSGSEAIAIGEASRHLLMSQLAAGEDCHEGVISASIKGIAKTFAMAPTESAELIRGLLLPERVVQRGHSELFWLATEFKKFAREDPELAADIFIAAYTTPLPSSEEKTSIGGSRIMSLTSTKRQDFEGVLYALERSLDWFIASAPRSATRALKASLASYIRDRQTPERPPKSATAKIGARSVCVVEDLSFIWWSPDSSYRETHAKLVEALFDDLKKAPLERYALLGELFLDGEVWAGVVAAFLRAATSREDAGGNVCELLASPGVLSLMDTSFDAGQFISTRFTEFPLLVRSAIEESILQIEDENQRKVLVGCLLKAGVSPDMVAPGLRELATSDDHLPVNHPHFSLASGWSETDENWWLKEQGVNLEEPEVLELIEISDALAGGKHGHEKLPLQEKWKQARDLLGHIRQMTGMNDSLRNKVMDAIAEVAEEVCQLPPDGDEVRSYSDVREVIVECLDLSLSPKPEIDEENERQFARGPSWGRPAPRIVGASALMAYIRQTGLASPEDRQFVLNLAVDPAVAVRHAVLSRANAVCVASPALARELAEIAFLTERNEGVLRSFLHSFDKYVSQDIMWSASQVLQLENRLKPSSEEDKTDSLRTAIVHTILRFWLTWDINAAENRVKEWACDPLRYPQQVQALISDLRQLVVFGEPDGVEQRSDAIRENACCLTELIIRTLVANFEELWKRAATESNVREPLTLTTRLLNESANQLYFGSGAYDLSKSENLKYDARGQKIRRRFLSEYLPSLQLLARVSYPAITHPILEIVESMIDDEPELLLQLVFDAMQEGGAKGGYQFESLGADLIVKIARKYLADYTSLLASSPKNRGSLLDVLNIFADTGWAEAKKLVYELPEAMR